jgi:hypothetical protein
MIMYSELTTREQALLCSIGNLLRVGDVEYGLADVSQTGRCRTGTCFESIPR